MQEGYTRLHDLFVDEVHSFCLQLPPEIICVAGPSAGTICDPLPCMTCVPCVARHRLTRNGVGQQVVGQAFKILTSQFIKNKNSDRIESLNC